MSVAQNIAMSLRMRGLPLVGRFALSRAADLGVADYRSFPPNFPAFDAFP